MNGGRQGGYVRKDCWWTNHGVCGGRGCVVLGRDGITQTVLSQGDPELGGMNTTD